MGIFDKVKQIFKIGPKKVIVVEPSKPIIVSADITKQTAAQEIAKTRLNFKNNLLKMTEEILGRGPEYYKIEKMNALNLADLYESSPGIFDVFLEYDLEGLDGEYSDEDWKGPTEEEQIKYFIKVYETNYGG
jgi:hypothetical protein